MYVCTYVRMSVRTYVHIYVCLSLPYCSPLQTPPDLSLLNPPIAYIILKYHQTSTFNILSYLNIAIDE